MITKLGVTYALFTLALIIEINFISIRPLFKVSLVNLDFWATYLLSIFKRSFATDSMIFFLKISVRVWRDETYPVTFGQISGPPLWRRCVGYLEPSAMFSRKWREREIFLKNSHAGLNVINTEFEDKLNECVGFWGSSFTIQNTNGID